MLINFLDRPLSGGIGNLTLNHGKNRKNYRIDKQQQ
jgi:hypothetical protein